MSGVPLLLITPSESRNLADDVPLTESGAVRRVPFDGGSAFFVEEGTTNLIPNPSFEHWAGSTRPEGWFAQSSTLSADKTTKADGSQSTKITLLTPNRGVAIFSAAYDLPVEPNTTYAVSFWIKANRETLQRSYHSWRNVERQSVGSPSTASYDFAVTTDWQRVTYTVTTPDDPSVAFTYIVIYADQIDPQAGDEFWVDAVQFEPKPYATTFTHGGMGAGYSWTGTPHNSASVREAASISAPLDSFHTVYIRHDGGSTVLTEPSAFGEHGLLTHADGMLTVSTARETTVAAVIAYDRPLTEAERARLDAIPTSELSWANIATPEMRLKLDGEVVRAAGMYVRRNGLLKPARLG